MPPTNLGSSLGSIVSTAVKPLYDCFIEQATYLFTTGRNVRDLDTNTRTFAGQRDDVQQQLETGRRNGLVQTNEARTWLERANKAITDEKGNRERYEQRCKIFGCWAPNCWSNYKISKKAAKTLDEVNWCRKHKPETITLEGPPQPVEIVQVMSVSLKESQVSILNKALRHIKHDANVGLVGIWGPRQVGKTLLLKMINSSFCASTDTCGDPTHPSSGTSEQTGIVDHSTSEIIEESTFHFVIYVIASTNCTVENIQSEILRRLNIQVQDGASETTRAAKISGFLQDKSFLVLLDDLQNGVDLSAVGLPHPLGVVDGQLKRKVVLTTRARNLCHNMNVDKLLYVSGLEMEEALELFKDSADGDNLYSDPNIIKHMKNLVDILKAVPAELIIFGRDMRGKGDPIQWQDVIHVVNELIKMQDREATSLREGIVKRLNEDVEKVREKSSDVRDKIADVAKGNNGMVATDKAKTWLSRADTLISYGTDICDSERTKDKCDISIAAAMLRELRECLNDLPSDIVQPPSVMHIPVHDDLQPSQVCFVKLARQHIIDDPEGRTVIWGPVGVGKTLLLNMINNSFEAENSLNPCSSSNRGEPPFDFVIYLTASEECLVGNIQSQIMQRLKMEDGDSVTIRATRIYEFLQHKSFLVLLDDLRTNLDLAAVGLPPLGIHGTLKKKVVVTTRSRNLCAQMPASRGMEVSGLDLDESLQLFQRTVGCENLYSNPRIGEHAKDIVDSLRARPSELIKFGMELHTVGDPKQWEDIILNKKGYSQQPSRYQVFKEAMEYIKHQPVDVIGIWGLGGVGKTHLLEKIQDQANSLFDRVISVTASNKCSVQNIQDQIVQKHKLKEAHGVQNQAKIISEFLEGKSFVLLLDDLWDHIDLRVVGIPYEGQQRRKVVITTRDMKVCRQMEVRKVIKVACLPYNEAWKLFEDKVEQSTLSSSHGIEKLARELVKELNGLPLALITTGTAMWGKSDPEEWQYAIDYMKKSCCDENDPLSMETVFRKLKYSFDSLKNDVLKQCFLTCSLWPEDWIFQMEELYECWTGLGIVDKSDIHGCYREVHNIVGELKAASLLETCEYSKNRSFFPVDRGRKTQRPLSIKVSVKMHDVVRDMAIWISNDCGKSNDKWVVRAGIGGNLSRHTIPWRKVECVSLMCSAMKKLPPFSSDHCCMKLKTLCLKRNCLSEFIAGSGTSQFFTALTYLDLSWNNLTRISESLCGLTNLEYLNVSNNLFIEEVPVSLGQLNKLKFLYLGGTRIRMIPKGIISSLKELEVVDLITESITDDEFGTDWIIRELCTLANLKAVDIAVRSETEYYQLLKEDPDLPFRNLVIINLGKTSGLCLTDGIFSSEVERRALYQLRIKDCSVEKIVVADMPGPFEALKVLSLFHLHDLNEIMWKGTIPQGLFPRLTHVDIFSCNKLQHLSWVMYLPCLQYLDVRRCHNMKQAFLSTENSGEERASVDTFPCLICLHLEGHRELTSLCDSDVTFPSLESLHIIDCPKLEKLPFTRQSMPKKLNRKRKQDGVQPSKEVENDGIGAEAIMDVEEYNVIGNFTQLVTAPICDDDILHVDDLFKYVPVG
ncbi:unnamed protein product [Urochloa decumbens]|uniref:AAA+ ATPase domain-containing protein n=1 Tax=Urochloa decumbens TaxID=240449 RepID=A0ABC9AWK1_9POAL